MDHWPLDGGLLLAQPAGSILRGLHGPMIPTPSSSNVSLNKEDELEVLSGIISVDVPSPKQKVMGSITGLGGSALKLRSMVTILSQPFTAVSVSDPDGLDSL